MRGLQYGTEYAFSCLKSKPMRQTRKEDLPTRIRLSAVVQPSLPVASRHCADGLLDYQ